MKPNPNVEITGTVTRFNLESDTKGAVLVAYTEDEHGNVGRSWLRFDPAAMNALKTRAAGLPDAPAEEGVTARPFPRFVLEPGWVDVDRPGWDLKGDKESGERLSECHETFRPDDHNADIEAAMAWAEDLIGARQEWTHVRERGFDRWEAGTRD
ncbi:hypothetical protein ACIQU6_40100 [Streptomyces sp. NPDC090442]|uniref:hypothetical protein n=1 Tax=Streptomyces sp. NPDC090442 TaxID=3365962 RepID=UPI0038271547